MHKLQLGMPTLVETKNLEASAVLCNELDLQFIELNMNLPGYQTDRIDTGVFAEIAQKHKIYYTIHLDENLNPCDFNKRIADAYKETVVQTIDLAKQLHIPVLNMHLAKGVYFTMPEKKVYLFDEYMDIYLTGLTAFRDQCDKAIGGSDIKICIENADGYDREFLRRGRALLLESKSFSLTFDIGHNAAIGSGDEGIIMKNIDHLCHMHIHDAKGKNSHLPLGTGELDLDKYFNLANKQNCRIVLETKNAKGLRESVEWIRKHLIV